uniref:Uncharacterized protein n=1 Tax=Avena sativa TaxID=4498 RepID=A0ACD5VUQ8_AVESA
MVTLRSQRDTGKPIAPDPASLEFCKFMSYGLSWEKLVLPDKFGNALMCRDLRKVKLRVAGGGGRRAWDVKVVLDKYGDVYLAGGWRKFARANGLDLGQLLVFRYDGVALITITVLEGRPCEREEEEEEQEEEEEEEEQEEEEEEEDEDEDEVWDGTEGNSSPPPPAPAPSPMSSGSSVGGAAAPAAEACTDDPASSLFTVTLRKCHFGTKQRQYLHVPIWFNEAYRYAERTKVVLQMRGKSWTVSLKHSSCGGGTRTGGTSSASTMLLSSATPASSVRSRRTAPAAVAAPTTCSGLRCAGKTAPMPSDWFVLLGQRRPQAMMRRKNKRAVFVF